MNFYLSRFLLPLITAMNIDVADAFAPNFPGNDGMGKPLSYDKIQKLIDVSRPYYKLENEREIISDQNEATRTDVEFTCTVKPEMPFCREVGPMTSAEAGRHMAIAGSVAAALNNKRVGKHYYLALSNELSRITLPDGITNTGVVDAAYSPDPSSIADEQGEGEAMITARCNGFFNRNKEVQCKITMRMPRSNEVWHLVTTYRCIPDKVFKKSYKISDDDYVNLLPLSSPSPYAEFQGLDASTFELLDVGTKKGVLEAKSHIPAVSDHQCLGHFDFKKALPVAILAAYCFDFVGYSISSLLKIEIPFKRRSTSTSRLFLESSSHESSGGDELSCKLVNVKLDAEKLVFANDHGLVVYCKIDQDPGHPSLFSVKVEIKSDDDNEALVAKLDSVWITTPTTTH